MPPKRKSPRETTIESSQASRAKKAVKTTEKDPAITFNVAETGKSSTTKTWLLSLTLLSTDRESDGDTGAEEIALVLNTATKRKSTSKKPGFLAILGGGIRRTLFRENQAEEAEEAEEEEVEQNGDDQVADVMEEASRVFPYVQAPSVEALPAKRTLEKISDAEKPSEDEPIQNPPKRGKAKGRGKQPLEAPKTSGGQILEVVIQSTPEKNTASTPKKRPGRKPGKKAQSSPKNRTRASKKAASLASSVPENDQEIAVPAPQPRSSGRPRKITTTVESAEETSSSPSVPPIDPQDYEEGFTEILMNPSPVKVTKPNSGAITSNATQKVQSKRGRPANGYESPSSDEEDNKPEEKQRQREETTDSSERHPIFIDTELLQSLIEKARRVGHTQNRKTREWVDVSGVKKISTQGGEKIHRLLVRLSSSYETLKTSNLEEDREAIEEAKVDVTSRLQRLAKYAIRMVTTRLDGNADEYMVTKLLKDLYFFIFPDWLDCMQLASECYTENGAMTSQSLQEMQTLLDSYCELADSAISQPTNIQPKGDYQTSKPTREIVPHIHKLCKSMQKEAALKSHTSAAARELKLQIEREMKREHDQPVPSVEDVEVKRLQSELAKVHREREEKIERERRRQIKEIHRRQAEQIREALEREKMDYAEFERRGSKNLGSSRGGSRTENLQHRLASLTHEEGEEDDPFSDNYVVQQNGRAASSKLRGEEDEDERNEGNEDEYEVERVEVFPHNNKSLTTPMPWSDREKLIFIKCMIRGGRDKYERAAEKLLCSMDEVFAAAKELQEAHDKAHAAGSLNGPDDGWTYHVWGNAV
ncbi:hypothetical protein HYFRA_00013207 [Hymenoscyphus fraxineus]|uniref:Uncharacterized protein n=1 Tax=Hymenoscyphus fraxineus TaxID=746836 RepID=A0A9N9PMT9_9HELO|nr:hypothetical protein HYFRA_00013207 [Hymenoscyphus fraxineus]